MNRPAFTRVCAFLMIGAGVIFAAKAESNVWRYYAANEEGSPTNEACIVQMGVENGWTILVTAKQSTPAKGMLCLNDIVAGQGVLDLRDVILQDKDGKETAVVDFKWSSYKPSWPDKWTGSFYSKCPIEEFYANHVSDIQKDSLFSGNTSLRKVFIGGKLATVQSKMFYNCSNLTNVFLDADIATFNGEAFSGTALTNKFDVSNLVRPCVKTIEQNGLLGCSGMTGHFIATNYTKLAGGFAACSEVTLGGPAMTNVTNFASPFRGTGNVKSISLEFPNAGIFSGGSSAFQDAGATNLCIKMPMLTNVTDEVFTKMKELRHLTILGKALGTNVIDRMCEAVRVRGGFEPNDVTKRGNYPYFNTYTYSRLTLYCSKKQEGWKELAKPLVAGTYEATNAPAGCFGMYVTAAGERMAWMVHYPQPDDPSGLCIRIQ